MTGHYREGDRPLRWKQTGIFLTPLKVRAIAAITPDWKVLALNPLSGLLEHHKQMDTNFLKGLPELIEKWQRMGRR